MLGYEGNHVDKSACECRNAPGTRCSLSHLGGALERSGGSQIIANGPLETSELRRVVPCRIAAGVYLAVRKGPPRGDERSLLQRFNIIRRIVALVLPEGVHGQ